MGADSTETKVLNRAFFDYACEGVDEEYFSAISSADALHFDFEHTNETLGDVLDDFYENYELIKGLTALEYVKSINIVYFYSMPDEFFNS